MTRHLIKLIVLLGLALLLLTLIGAFKIFQGAAPAILPPPDVKDEVPATGTNTTGLPLSLPGGFSISVFARDLPGARVLARDTFGNFWVSQPSAGIVSLLEVSKDGRSINNQGAVFRGLNRPHGLAFDPAHPFNLYIAEEDKISVVPVYSEGGMNKIADLPEGGRHTTRTLGFGPDERLYVSIGSSCDVCVEEDQRRAAVYSMLPDGGDFKMFAKGLRNAVFFTWHPETNEMWATEMGRDFLGDNLPPDEINIIREGANYGWPICYGKNIHDTVFDKNTYVRNPCQAPFETESHIDIPAHSAPLGLAFIPPNSAFPEEYWNDLLVSYHGSWNRTEPTGYKVVRMQLDEEGNYLGTEDFISGWLVSNGALGRPVDIFVDPSGKIYITDDKAGFIYLVEYTG